LIQVRSDHHERKIFFEVLMIKIEELERTIATLRAELESQKKRAEEMAEQLAAYDVYDDRGEEGHMPEAAGPSLLRSKLWSSISHEILTPMDAILGMTDLVLDTDLTDEQRNYLEMINASADRLFGVVSDVIDYSELVGGELRKDVVNFNLFKVFEYDLYIAELSAKHKELSFSYSFPKDIPERLNSDPGRLRQVLNNLVSNAIEFTSEGEVRVEVEKAGYDDNRRLLFKFTVQDTGRGIPAEVQKDIFQTPSPLNLSDGEGQYGEGGFGLVVSAKLVNLFGGEMGLTSKEGQGSTFWFTWPMIDPADAYMGELPSDFFSRKQDRSQVLKGAKVLLAEDEHINASITKAFLEQVGINVTVVNNGREAVELLDRQTYQAVLMDVQMPVMDGIEATQEIRKRERKRGTLCPIIALTAHAMHGDRERCLQAGMDDYLAKPLDKDVLIDMLARYMTRKALIVGIELANQQEYIQPLVEQAWDVIIADTGRLAMYEASLSHFDLIVVDISMPVDDTLETVRTIRKLEEFSGCRAKILGVGFGEKDDQTQYDGSGIDEFFSRSTMKNDFRQRITDLN
jgi:signal transduction histidine kinase/CheY-like chemotaxis protein